MRLPYPVVLASASPRRQELLRKMAIDFVCDPADIDEESFTVDDPEQTARRLAREKALAVFSRHRDSIVIGADTVVAVAVEGVPTQLAKPVDTEDAVRMLGILSGNTHTVVTGICVKWPSGISIAAESSEVTFGRMSDEQIRGYVATGEPMDKAGAYGLQGGARQFVTSIKGNPDNVIGLPVDRLRELLKEIG